MQEAITNIGKEFPDYITLVYEPFAGMCSVTSNFQLGAFANRDVKYMLNDIDSDKINALLCAQQDPEKLKTKCFKILLHYWKAKDKIAFFNKTYETYIPLEKASISNMDFNKAANYIFLNSVSNRHDNTSFDRKHIDRNIRYLEKRIHDIRAMHEILKKVDLSNKNYSKLLKIDPESVYTLDPEYMYTSGYKNKKGKFKFPKKII